MPILPTYTANKNISARTPAPARNEAAQSFNNINTITSALSDVTQAWSNAHDVMQYTDAKSKYEEKTLDIQSRALADPDFKNSASYIKELETAKSDSLLGIDNSAISNKLSMEFEHGNVVASIKMRADAQKKEIDYNKFQVNKNIEMLMNKKLSSSTEAESANYTKQINDLLNINVRAGVLAYDEADKILKDSQKTSVQYEIYSDPSTTEADSKVLNELKKNDGKYAFLDTNTRLDLIQESTRRIFQNNQTFKKDAEISSGQRTDNLIMKFAEGTANFRDIEEEYKIPPEQGGMPRKTLDAYQRRLQNGVQRELNQMLQEKTPDREPTKRAEMVKKYNDLIELFIDDSTDQFKAKSLLAESYADGIISAKEQQTLNELKKNLKDIEFNRSTNPFVSAFRAIKDRMKASNASDEEIALRIKQLVDGIGGGESPESVSRNILDSEMLKYFPDYKSYSTKGKKKIDVNSGRAYLVFPDGTWQWVGANE